MKNKLIITLFMLSLSISSRADTLYFKMYNATIDTIVIQLETIKNADTIIYQSKYYFADYFLHFNKQKKAFYVRVINLLGADTLTDYIPISFYDGIGFFDGKCISRMNNYTRSKYYYKKGLKEGKEKVYYPNGNLMEIYTFKNNLRHGWYKSWDENSKLQQIVKFKNDKAVIVKIKKEGYKFPSISWYNFHK